MRKFDPLRFSDHRALIEAENLLLWVMVNKHPTSELRRHLLAFIEACNKVKKPAKTPRRLKLKEGREHLTVTNEFQSDKYPWCHAGFVPLKVTDPLATDLLAQYADRRRTIDAEFSRDLHDALAAAGGT